MDVKKVLEYFKAESLSDADRTLSWLRLSPHLNEPKA